ncbi:DUF2971 domain-containing protein [Methylomonas koyamae]|uniref:DUF2971 domain-containing protein n=1 Tax=Methylomonas koyamae TaxID=702114 RepID=A0AA91DAH2_9GAMM|nr:DUF2971 domain-containing protein [Methylomonas koyamae]OAI23909.1 hypothetical protein A1356_16760 [Methylomonas koyamae]
MRVFYLTGAQYGISNIALRRIKVSRFSELNDPFELLGVNLSDKAKRAAFRKTKEELDESKGLICFTRSWKNPVLWGHYAEKHTGIALGLDIPDHLLVPVIYSKRLLDVDLHIKSGKPPKELVDRLIRTKFYDWKYESEVRLFVGLDHKTAEGGRYFFPFSDEVRLAEVILGPKCDLPVDGVRELLRSQNSSANVIKARIAFSRFEVLENQAATRADEA